MKKLTDRDMDDLKDVLQALTISNQRGNPDCGQVFDHDFEVRKTRV